MMLPFSDGLLISHRGDQECRVLADRHYSRQKPGTREFCGNGSVLVLRDYKGTCLFVWMRNKPGLRLDGQDGFCCIIFRNESSRLSSEIILEAEAIVDREWGPARKFTYIDPTKIRSKNPGCCFKRAGYKFAGVSVKGKHLLVKENPSGFATG